MGNLSFQSPDRPTPQTEQCPYPGKAPETNWPKQCLRMMEDVGKDHSMMIPMDENLDQVGSSTARSSTVSRVDSSLSDHGGLLNVDEEDE